MARLSEPHREILHLAVTVGSLGGPATGGASSASRLASTRRRRLSRVRQAFFSIRYSHG